MTLEEALKHIGHPVAYRTEGAPAEYGVITTVGKTMAFVRYGDNEHAKATSPGDLELLAAPAAGTEKTGA